MTHETRNLFAGIVGVNSDHQQNHPNPETQSGCCSVLSDPVQLSNVVKGPQLSLTTRTSLSHNILDHDRIGTRQLQSAQRYTSTTGSRGVLSRANAMTDTCMVCACLSTPEWRRGPAGIRSLCNGCGLQYAKRVKQRRKRAEQLHPQTTEEIVDELAAIGTDRFKASDIKWELPTGTVQRIGEIQARTIAQQQSLAATRSRKAEKFSADQEAAGTLLRISRRLSTSSSSSSSQLEISRHSSPYSRPHSHEPQVFGTPPGDTSSSSASSALHVLVSSLQLNQHRRRETRNGGGGGGHSRRTEPNSKMLLTHITN